MQEYDRIGVWPPQRDERPQPGFDQSRRSHARGRSYPAPRVDPFFDEPSFDFDPFGGAFHRSRSPRDFTDPFVFFNTMFSDFFRHGDPFDNSDFFDFPRSNPLFRSPLFNHPDPFSTLSRGSPIFGPEAFLLSSTMDNDPFRNHSTSFQSSSRGYVKRGSKGDGRIVSESRITQTVNGVTQSVWKRSDSNVSGHSVSSSFHMPTAKLALLFHASRAMNTLRIRTQMARSAISLTELSKLRP